MAVTMFGYLILISREFLDFIYLFPRYFSVSKENIHQTIKTMVDQSSKHLDVRRSPLGVHV